MQSISSILTLVTGFQKDKRSPQQGSQSSQQVRSLALPRGRENKVLDNSTRAVEDEQGFQHPTSAIAVKRSRSRSIPRANKVRHLPDSRVIKGRNVVVDVIRHHPSFENFKDPQINKVEITREQYEALQAQVGDSAKDVLSESDATAWEVLQNPIAYQIPLKGKSTGNSNYDNTHIEMEHLRPWENFPTFKDIETFIKTDTRLSEIFFNVMLENAGSKTWFEGLYNDPGYIPANEENSLARNCHSFFAQLSTLIRLACHGHPGDQASQESLAVSQPWVTIGGGKCAMKRRNKGNSNQKVPDLVAYWTNGDHSHLNVRKSQPNPAGDTYCLIVGDFKMTPKFHHSMLLPSDQGRYNREGKKVVDQIHDYMDMHHNRYGYVITHTELIMFRRRDSPKEVWGQMDFSRSIPVSTERGTLNAMMALWYFHVKYAVMGEDGGWKLRSYYHNCPTMLLGTSAGSK